MPETSFADFEALVRRAGLTLTPEEIGEFYQGWGGIESMLELVRLPRCGQGEWRGRDAAPASVFLPDSF